MKKAAIASGFFPFTKQTKLLKQKNYSGISMSIILSR
jgi:hypothetical protein